MKLQKYKLRIKDMPAGERPREKLVIHGPKALSNAELLSIILGYGSTRHNVADLSKKLLKENSLKSLSRKRIGTLKTYFGIGEVKACKIIACFELSRRLAAFKKGSLPKANNPKEVAEMFMPEMSALKKEQFKCLLVDSRNRIIKEEIIFIGSLNSSVVHPREIFQFAIEEGAAALILIHNHPSGSSKPSDEDIEFTSQIVKAGKIMEIEIIDHIIIGNKEYFSFRERNCL